MPASSSTPTGSAPTGSAPTPPRRAAYKRAREEGQEYIHSCFSVKHGHRFFVLDDVFYQFSRNGEYLGSGSPASAWASSLKPKA